MPKDYLYKNVFNMLATIPWMREKYDYYNKLLWDGKLPSISFKINNSSKTWGYATYGFNTYNNSVTPKSITMSNRYDSPENVKLGTLIHEMIHIADYTFNPHHFVWNHEKVSKRSYNSHGYDYFIPEMNRINKILKNQGIIVSPKATESEKQQSELSQKNKELLNRKIENGVHVFVSKLKNRENSYEYTMAVVQSTMYNEWKFYVENSEWWKQNFLYTDDYLTKDERLASRKSKRVGRSNYLIIPLDDLIKNYNLYFNKRLYENEAQQNSLSNFLYGDGGNPHLKYAQQQSHLIPLFKMNTMQGGVIELKNTTKDNIKATLKEKFPKWSDEVIERTINNKNFYPMGENKIKITEKDIKQITEAVVDRLINSKETQQIPGQRRSKPRQINKYEFEESIE